MAGLARTLLRLALRRGLAGSRNWLLVWAGATLWSRSRRRAKRPPPVLHSEVLGPGESVRISVFKPGR